MSHNTSALQFAEALASLRRVRAVLVLLLSLCLLAQIAAACFLHFVSEGDSVATKLVIEPAPVEAELPAPETSAEPTDGAPAGSVTVEATPLEPAVTKTVFRTAQELAKSDDGYAVLFWVLSATKFGALFIATILMLTLMFSVKLGLLGQLGAPGGFMGGFYWSMLLVAILIPWQQVMQSDIACGATFNFTQFLDLARASQPKWGASEAAGLPEQILFYSRIIAYPAVALIVTLLASLGFGRGYRPIRLSQQMAASMGTRPAISTESDSSTIQL